MASGRLCAEYTSQYPRYGPILIGGAASDTDVTFGFGERFALAVFYVHVMLNKQSPRDFGGGSRVSVGAGNVAFVETFAWKSDDAARTAHETPEVMRLWEPMGALCADMEFWH